MKRAHLLFLSLFALSCRPTGSNVRNLDPVPEELPAIDPSLTHARLGSRLRALRDAAVRGGPSKDDLVRELVPKDAVVVIVKTSNPTDGYFLINYAGLEGWSHGSLYELAPNDYVPPIFSSQNTEITLPEGADETPDDPQPSGPTGPASATGPSGPTGASAPAPSDREAAIARAQSGVGFSYYWGHGSWDPSGANNANAGTCSGLCSHTGPSCTHTGAWGADCSGFVAKVWQVPASNTDLTDDSHPYGTITFNSQDIEWTTIGRADLQAADALVYNENGSGHILLFASGDGWGQHYSYESRGCSIGIVYNLRTADNRYKAIRRKGW